MSIGEQTEFVVAGMKQAGKMFGPCLVVLAVLLGLDALLGFPPIFFPCVLAGPASWLLLSGDVSDRQLCEWTLLAIVPYWASLGAAVGWGRWCASRISGASVDPSSPQVARQMQVAISLVLLLFGGLLLQRLWPGFDRVTPLDIVITHNLHEIDGAKQTLGLEKHLPPDYVPTEAELSPYLGRGTKIPHPAGPERYVIGAINVAPYAVIDKDTRVPRRGWREGYTLPQHVYRLPGAPP